MRAPAMLRGARYGSTANPARGAANDAAFDYLLRRSKAALYDPSNLASLYQDPAGSIPLTAPGQPVGLMLDCSNNLKTGPQLIINGNFDGTANWRSGRSAVLSATNNTLRVTMAGGVNAGGADQAIATVPGRMYRVSFNVIGWTGDILGSWMRVSNRNIDDEDGSTFMFTEQASSPGLKTFHFIAQSNVAYLFLQPLQNYGPGTDGAYIEYTKASIQEVPGKHMLQPSTPSRPTFQRLGRYAWLDFDGVDDFMYSHTEFDWIAANQMTAAAAYTRNKDAVNVFLELGPVADTTAGTFYLATRETDASGASFRVSSTSGAFDKVYGYGPALYESAAVVAQTDILAHRTRIRINGADNVTAGNISGSGMTKHTLYLGMRKDSYHLCFGGQFHGLAIGPKFIDGADLASVERWLSSRVPGINTQARIAFGPALLAMRSFNDWQGLYQDPLGTLPVTAANQPVGLMVDQARSGIDLVVGGTLISDVVASAQTDGRGSYTQCITNGGVDPYFGYYYTAPSNGLYLFEVEVWGSQEMEGRLYLYDSATYTVINESPIAITTTPTTVRIHGECPAGLVAMRVDGPDARGGGSVPAGLTYNIRFGCQQYLPGVHWKQTAIQSRPLSKQVGNKKMVHWDGVDDFMNAVAMPYINAHYVLAASLAQRRHPVEWRTLFDGLDTSDPSNLRGVRVQNIANSDQIASATGRGNNSVAVVEGGTLADQQPVVLMNWWDGSQLGIDTGIAIQVINESSLQAGMKAQSYLGGEGSVAFFDGDMTGFMLAQANGVASRREVTRRWASSKQ